MKKFICLLASLGLLVGVTGCKKEKPVGPNPSETEVMFKVTVDANLITATTANVVIESQNVERYAYIINPANVTTAPDVIFAIGETGSISGSKTTLTLSGLEAKTDYKVYFAAQIDSDTYFDDVVEITFKTIDFTDEVTVYGITGNSFSIHVNLPEETAQRVTSGETAIRSIAMDLFTYNYRTANFGVTPDAFILSESGRDDYYPDNVHQTASFTRVFDDAHIHPSGEGWEIPGDAEYSFYYYPIVPGQPEVVIMGEFSYREPEYDGDWFGYIAYENYFDEEAFFNDYFSGAMIPDANSEYFEYKQDQYWSGYYKRLALTSEKPAKFNAGVTAVPHITPMGGSIELIPDSDVELFVFTLFDKNVFDVVMPYLNNNDNYLQWFLTSYAAYEALYMYSASGPASVNIDDILLSVSPGDVVSLLVVSMGDQYGNTQNYQRFDFTIPESTKPAPVIEVTPISNPSGEEDPYSIWFNIKSVGSEPVYLMKYAANDKTSWENLLAISDYDEVLDYYGNEINAVWYPDEISAINSPEGLNVQFWSRDEETTILAVKAMNDEGVYSSAVWAENTTIADVIPPVESELYTALEGEWTITVPVMAQYDDDWDLNEETGEWEIIPGEKIYRDLVGKVTIGNASYPATLTNDVYELYANTSGMDKAAVDKLYDEFKSSVDAFNDKTQKRNRILMNGFPGNLGWDDNVSEELEYASPYDLFTSSTYNGATINSIISDFGPKWYLQVNADGSVCVPVNYYLNPKLTGWVESDWYLSVGDALTRNAFAVLENYTTIEVPVEISEDRNTITIKPFVYDGIEYRLGCGMDWGSGYFEYKGVTYGDVVLTRGWSNSNVPSKAAVNRNGKKLKEVKMVKPKESVLSIELNRTSLTSKAASTRTEIKVQPITEEQFHANVQKHIKRVERARQR